MDTADDIVNGAVAIMETEKVDTKQYGKVNLVLYIKYFTFDSNSFGTKHFFPIIFTI